jgi:hypothetical protein
MSECRHEFMTILPSLPGKTASGETTYVFGRPAYCCKHCGLALTEEEKELLDRRTEGHG